MLTHSVCRPIPRFFGIGFEEVTTPLAMDPARLRFHWQDEDRITFGDALFAIQRLLRFERESLRQ